MSTLLDETDFDTVQLMYGFVLIASALVLSVALAGNVYALTGLVCLLLLKDGIPNFIVSALKISRRKDKVV